MATGGVWKIDEEGKKVAGVREPQQPKAAPKKAAKKEASK